MTCSEFKIRLYKVYIKKKIVTDHELFYNFPIGGLPPAYLSIEGHEDCLGEYSPSPVSTAVCLPSTRPSDCQRRAWFELKGKLVNCPEEPVIGGIGKKNALII